MTEAFHPINPYELSDEEMDAYFERFTEVRWHEERGVPEIYSGSQKFLEFIRDGVIGLGVIIRVSRYEWLKDPHYMITPDGLVDLVHRDGKTYSAKEALDVEGKPQWEIVEQGIYIPED